MARPGPIQHRIRIELCRVGACFLAKPLTASESARLFDKPGWLLERNSSRGADAAT